MIVAIHQPNYLPYLGFFHKIALADLFVLYDTAQFSKNEFHNRNRIKTPRGPLWLTVPVRNPAFQAIRNVEISGNRWKSLHWKTIQSNYSRSSFLGSYSSDLGNFYSKDWRQLSLANEALIRFIAAAFGYAPTIKRASELGDIENLSASAKLAEIVRRAGGDAYLSGRGASRYLKRDEFGEVKLLVQEFNHTEYPPLWGPFVPDLSALDFLLNVGEKSRGIIESMGQVRPWNG